MQKFTLNDGNQIPTLGFGTWQMQGDICKSSVLTALEVGYRHIDTADKYENHIDIAKALKESAIKREDLFVTSKVWFTDLKHDDLIDSCHRFLSELEIPYLDLLLIHWPNRQIPLQESLDAMNKLKEKKLIKSFGVSNFTTHHLQDCVDTGSIPAVNQVELHPSFGQFELDKFCVENKITLTAYSPLGQGGEVDDPKIMEIAKKYGKTPAQIILNWIISRGIVAIPKSTNPERIKENFESLGFELEDVDIQQMNDINKNNRILIAPWADFEY